MPTDTRYNQNYGAVQNDPYYQQRYGDGQQQPYPAGYYQQPYPSGYHPQPAAEEAVILELESQTAKELNILGFNNKVIRAAFIRKVFGLLSCMLVIVFGMVALFQFQQDCKQFIRDYSWIIWIAVVVFFVTYITIICCDSVRRRYPGNLICLFLLTVSMGFLTVMITAYEQTGVVIMAVGICALSCASIIVFSTQTKYDFTSWMGVMFIVVWVLLLVGLMSMFGLFYTVPSHFLLSNKSNKSRDLFQVTLTLFQYLSIVYAGLCALVFMVFLAIDTQLIVGGKRYELSPEEYILGAVMLFIDIIYIFWYLVQIIGGISRSN